MLKGPWSIGSRLAAPRCKHYNSPSNFYYLYRHVYGHHRGLHTSLSTKMKWYAQIVKPSTHNQQSTSVLVQIDSQRYLFNCGEGTQRLGFENKIRMSKLSAIFLTRIDWETMGGLPGMLLTLADSGMGDLTVCGGYNLTHVLAATRHFIMRDRMGLRVNEMLDGDATAAFQDKNLQ
ncbi:hypothetical protein GGF41_004363, partial [Coemansia sp. RSA 2531]